MPGSVILDHWGHSFPTSQEREEERLARDSLRFDRWENGLTGIGTGADKLNGQGHGRFFPTWRVLDQELSNLHSGSDLAKHAVDRRPKEMFRRGYTIESDDLTSSQTEAVREYATDVLDLDTNMREAFRWGRLYGGCLLLLDVDDGGYPWEPLDEENIRSFNSVSLIDRRYAYVQSQYSSMNGAHYGRPEIYLVSNAVAVSGWNSHEALRKKSGWELMREGGQATLVHESRTIRFDGDDADIVTRQRLAGWSWSILQKVYDAMRQFEHAFDSVGYLLADANQGVFTLQGLVKSITSGQRSAFVSRMQMMEATRSVMRGIALDAGDSQRGIPAETFERKPTSFGSIPELLQVMMLRLAAAFEEPATILFGRAPGGLNASGDNEMRSWYDQIGSDQENEVQPRAKRCYRLISLAKQGPVKGKDARFKIKFKPLWTPTDDEVAKTLLTNAQRDTIYLGTGVVKPEEVAVDLGDVYPNLDVEAREQVIEAGKSFEPYPKDPKAPPPGAGGPPGAPGAPPGAGGAGGPGKAGPMQPTSASSVNGTAGEPIGGPQVPMPLLGGGSIGGAKPATGKTPAVFGAPSALRPKGGATISPKQGANFRQTGGVRDDFDPGEERVPAGSPGGGQFAGKGGGGGGGEHEAKPAEPKQSLRERAAALVGHVKGFLGSKEVREQVVSHAISAIKASPGKLGKAAVAKVKETYHEAKTAFAGVRVALNGGTMSPEQKHAVKTIAIHVASRVAASAIMAAIPLSAAASPLIERLSGEIARKVAEHVSEHIAHHVAEHAAKHIFSHLAGIHDAEVDPEEWLADVIEKAVAAELANLSPADLDGLASSFKGDANDAHDPKQPRGVGGRLSSHKATGMGADAYEAGDAAHESHDPDDHLTAAAAHGHAAVEYRQLAARHARLGNTAAASRHEAQAEEHQGEGTIHTELAAREAARQAGALLDDPPALSKMPAVVPPPNAQNPDVETGNDRKDADQGGWDESKVSRAPNGQFGSGGSEGDRPKAGSAVEANTAVLAAIGTGEGYMGGQSPEETAQQLDRLLPGARLDAIERAFGGDRATSKITSAFAYRQKNDQVEVHGNLLNKRGEKIGDFVRTFRRDPDGSVVATHDDLHLSADAQGKGVGHAILRDTLSAEKAAGVARVELNAAEVGKYVWAEHGFNWDEETGRSMRHAFADHMKANGVEDWEARNVAREHSAKAYELAAVEVDHQPVGKNFLLGKGGGRAAPMWKGTLNLKEGDAGWEHAKRKLGL